MTQAPHWSDKLPETACADAVAWCRTQESPAAAWKNCTRADWMLWLLADYAQPVDKPKFVAIAVQCAQFALPAWEQARPTDHRPRAAIEAAEKWLLNPNSENANAARAARAAAATAADAARAAAARAAAAVTAARAAAAANAAYAAAHAADAAAYAADAAADAAANAAYAAANAAYTAANAAYTAANAAYTARAAASVVRQYFPHPPTLDMTADCRDCQYRVSLYRTEQTDAGAKEVRYIRCIHPSARPDTFAADFRFNEKGCGPSGRFFVPRREI